MPSTWLPRRHARAISKRGIITSGNRGCRRSGPERENGGSPCPTGVRMWIADQDLRTGTRTGVIRQLVNSETSSKGCTHTYARETPEGASPSRTPWPSVTVGRRATSVLRSKMSRNGGLRRQAMSIWSEVPCNPPAGELNSLIHPLKIPCSVQRLGWLPVREVWQNESLTAMTAELRRPKFAKFPVLFPVSREFMRRRVRS